MSIAPLSLSRPEVLYPDSDGLPMADNTVQFRYITTIKGGLEAQYAADPNVFVAGDLFWYAREGVPSEVMAPDTLVVFGRPKGDRGSYQQWREGNIPPQVVFEILSPNNTPGEMARKFSFYDRHGAEEYYLFDPDTGRLEGWQRVRHRLQPILAMDGWVSPRLGIRFQLRGNELVVFGTDGRPFVSYEELVQQRQAAERELDQVQGELDRQRERTARLAAQLRALGLDPDL
jgi:Uma2 family endonuclease